MLASVFPSPYVDILRSFKSDWSQAELAGDVREVIDPEIGKKVFALRGVTAASNYISLPKQGTAGLGLSGANLYLELCLVPGAPFTIHFDLITDAKFVLRVSLSSRYASMKRVGTVVQVPCPDYMRRTAGRWTVLALHLPELASKLVEFGKGSFAALKGIVACASLNLRAAFTSDAVFTPETLPRDFTLPLPHGKTFYETHVFLWLPGPPPAPQPAPASPVELASKAASKPMADRKPSQANRGASPATFPAGGKQADGAGEAVRRRRQRSGAAPRALFPPPPKPSEPAEPTLLKLSRVLGYSGERNDMLVWLRDGRQVLYASASLLILQDIDSAEQRFLIGHTADICAISAAETTPLVASAQEGPLPIIRLWDREACVPLAMLQQHASHMHTLSLSADGALLAAVGKDARGRQMLAVWDVTQANAPIPSCPLLDAKVSQAHIKAIRWVPPDPMDEAARQAKGQPASDSAQLVSCGYENVRFWRLRRGKLHTCGMQLQHEEQTLFLSIAIDSPVHSGGGSERTAQRRMLVGGSSGRLFVIDPTTRTLEYVHQLHEDAISAVHLSAGFAVTGGADHKLRVWPLDFSAHFLEAEHEGGVTAIDASPDGLKLLVGTASGTIGVLDVPTLKHATIVRSHTDIIYGLAMDPHNREFVTASCDGSIRVWELDGNQSQLVEFELPAGCARAVAYHPTEYVIACGFDDGSMRVFDVQSTSLLEEYTQHKGKVLDLLYSHSAERLFSAGTDSTICAYDAVHSYQPSRTYAAKPYSESKPCLALTSDDAILVAGALQHRAVVLLEAASLTALAILPTSADITSVALGPARTLFMTTAEGSLISLPLSASAAAEGGAPATVAVTPGVHKGAADAIAISRNGAHLVTGGHDRKIKLWPIGSVREGGPPKTGTGAGTCQPYVGHSDVVTKIAVSTDGKSLLSVGGGDAIFVWDYVGPAGVDEAELVEESLRQAERERVGQLAERQTQVERQLERMPTPAQVMGGANQEAGVDEEPPPPPAPAPTRESSVAAGLSSVAESAAERTVPVGGPKVVKDSDVVGASSDFDELRQRLRSLDTAQAGYMMAGVEAAIKAAAAASEAKQQPADEERERLDGFDDRGPDDDDDEEEEEGGADEEEALQEANAVHKRYRARHMYGDSDESEVAKMEAELEEASLGADRTEGGAGTLASRLAANLQLRRLIGFSTHAHDHVLWHPATAALVYATGDTLVVDSITPGTSPAYLTGGTGEISTLALSTDGRFAAVGSGGDAPTCVYDLAPKGRDLELAASADSTGPTTPSVVLRMRLPGHVGGVQSLAFLGTSALASLGLDDASLRVYSIVSGSLLLSAVTPLHLHTLAVSANGIEISAAGKGGIFTWRVSTQPGADGSGSRPALLPLPTRERPPVARDDDAEEEQAEVTALVHLSPTLSLAGDSAGQLSLWGPAASYGDRRVPLGGAEAGAEPALPIASFNLASVFSEIDVLHAASVVPSDGASAADELPPSWDVVVGGCSPNHVVMRFRLALPSTGEVTLSALGQLELDGDATAMSFEEGGEQGVVGTDAGSVWHLEWTTSAATLLVGAVPPPLSSVAVGTSTTQRVLATLSKGDVHGETCGVLLWDDPRPGAAAAGAACAAPLARIYQPNEASTCVAISQPTDEYKAYGEPEGADGLCAVGYASGRLQLVSVSSLRLLKERRVHMAPIAAIKFGPSRTMLTAAADGEVRLHSAAVGELLAPLATLRTPTNVPVTAIDMLVGSGGATDEDQPPRWLVASEHQQVQVWPLVARTDPSVTPIVTVYLEDQGKPLLALPAKLAALGWKCLAAFCPHRPSVIACTGLTRQRRLLLFDYMEGAVLASLSLDEWPTALAASDELPIVAVGGASGAVKVVEYLPDAQFCGSCLYSAAEDEVAQWQMQS